jgi:hypothetical protein
MSDDIASSAILLNIILDSVWVMAGSIRRVDVDESVAVETMLVVELDNGGVSRCELDSAG